MVVSTNYPYGIEALSDCCIEQVARAAYCGVEYAGFPNNGFPCIAAGPSVEGAFVPGAPANVACAIAGVIPTSQADCNNILANFIGGGTVNVNGTFVPAISGGIVSTGNCLLEATSDSSCGCPNSIPLTKSIDLCDLAGAALDHLNPNSLNLFGAPCA